MRVLILDDMPVRHEFYAAQYADDELTHVYTAQGAIVALQLNRFDIVQLDHDLGGVGRAPSGMDVVDALLLMPSHWWPKHVVVHSWNPVGAERMVKALRHAGVSVSRKAAGA